MLLSDLLLLFSTKCEVGLPSNSDKIFLLTIFQFLISQKVGFNFAKFAKYVWSESCGDKISILGFNNTTT